MMLDPNSPESIKLVRAIAERAFETNTEVGKVFTSIDHMTVIQEMLDKPEVLRLFQLQAMSMGTWCSFVGGDFGRDMAGVYAKAGACAANLIETLRMKNSIREGN